jgi:hypothetical protein
VNKVPASSEGKTAHAPHLPQLSHVSFVTGIIPVSPETMTARPFLSPNSLASIVPPQQFTTIADAIALKHVSLDDLPEWDWYDICAHQK